MDGVEPADDRAPLPAGRLQWSVDADGELVASGVDLSGRPLNALPALVQAVAGIASARLGDLPHRLRTEYGVQTRLAPAKYRAARWRPTRRASCKPIDDVVTMDADIKDFRSLIEQRLRELATALEQGYRGDDGSTALDQTRVGRLSRMDALQQQAMSIGFREKLLRERRRLEAALVRLDEGT